jgi:hypothetical protein
MPPRRSPRRYAAEARLSSLLFGYPRADTRVRFTGLSALLRSYPVAMPVQLPPLPPPKSVIDMSRRCSTSAKMVKMLVVAEATRRHLLDDVATFCYFWLQLSYVDA